MERQGKANGPSSQDELVQRLYHDLSRWVRYIASISQSPGHWLLDIDDITAEGYLVLWKIASAYHAKPYSEIKLLAKASVRNMVKTLYYQNARRLTVLSLDGPSPTNVKVMLGDTLSPDNVDDYFNESAPSQYIDPQYYVEAVERLAMLMEQLEPLDKRVLSILLGEDESAAPFVRMAFTRRNFVYTNPTCTISPNLVARLLGVRYGEVVASYGRIRSLL